MEFVPRFGHHNIPVSQINTNEVETSARYIKDEKKAQRLYPLWYPIIVEVLEYDKEYILVDGLRRLDFYVNTMKWGIVECIVMPASNYRERQRRRTGMNILSKSYTPYDMHCALYGMKKSGISDKKIIDISGVPEDTIRKYLSNLWLPLDSVLVGHRHKVGYDGWIEVLTIPAQYVPIESQELIRDAYLNRQCHAYQLTDIIAATSTKGFQALSHEDKVQVLREMYMQTTNIRASEKPAAAELFGFTIPAAKRVALYARDVLSKVDRLLQPQVLRNMPPSERQSIRQSVRSISNTFEVFDETYESKKAQLEDQLLQ